VGEGRPGPREAAEADSGTGDGSPRESRSYPGPERRVIPGAGLDRPLRRDGQVPPVAGGNSHPRLPLLWTGWATRSAPSVPTSFRNGTGTRGGAPGPQRDRPAALSCASHRPATPPRYGRSRLWSAPPVAGQGHLRSGPETTQIPAGTTYGPGGPPCRSGSPPVGGNAECEHSPPLLPPRQRRVPLRRHTTLPRP
jgi:hypothetical protein